MTKINTPNQVLSSDARHNRNCYAYFLQLKPAINEILINLLPELSQLKQYKEETYDANTPYGNLYSSLIASIEQLIEQEDKLLPEQNEALDQLVKAIYHNDNHILEHELAGWINELSEQARPIASNTSNLIQQQLKNSATVVNQTSPIDAEGLFSRLSSVLSRDFKPQFYTNIPTIKNFPYKSADAPIEHRFSTQAQRHNGQERVSPLFIRWLRIKAKDSSSHEINHIYFNNLAFHRNDLDIAGSKERELTSALHKLEEDPNLKVLVITLPANEGIMAANHYLNTENQLSYEEVFNELLDIALRQPNGSDLNISPKARELLFHTSENDQQEKQILTELLTHSFNQQGFTREKTLSTAQKQAVWVHFIKYTLTDYIIYKIKPESYNFSCKDAIDRGGLSSTYFNLMESFESVHPLKKEEFERSLDAAAASVKGRGMNFHRKIIWNALDTYINANYNALSEDSDKSWLIYWRDMNCPHSRAKQLIPLRIGQVKILLDSLDEQRSEIKVLGHKLLEMAAILNEQNTHGQRLLLEAVSRTAELITMPSEKSLENYKKLTEELKVDHPQLMQVAGIMEMIIGVLLYLPSLSFSQALINHGNALRKTGFFASERETLSQNIISLSEEFSI